MHKTLTTIRVAGRNLLAGGVLSGWFLTSAVASANTPNYFIRAWQVEEGLPQNKVTSVVQTHDGYLWVGTYSGLARFDGMRFAIFDDKNTPVMHSSRVTSLFESSDGTLWIGHEDGEVTTCKDGQFRAVQIHAARNGDKIYAITADEDGNVWLLTEAGYLIRARDGLTVSPPAGTAVKLLSVATATDGRIWVARDGLMSVLEHGHLRVFQNDGSITNTYVQGLCASRDGGVWVTSNGHLREWKENKWVQDLGATPWGQAALTCLTETKDGYLIAATSNNGFFILFPGSHEAPMHFSRDSGFQADWILSLMEDREGNLWVGTGGAGLISLRPNNIQTLSPPDHWRGRAVLSVCPGRDGKLWLGTEGAGLYCLQDGNWSNFGYTNGIGNSYVWSIAEDVAGNLWVGTWGAGLFLRDGDRFRFAPGMEKVMLPVPALLSVGDGNLWAGTMAGLLHYQSGKTNWFTEADGHSLRDVRTIAQDRNGAIWFGLAGNGLGCLENGKIRQYRQTNGLSSDYIECLHFDAENTLWIGTFGGGLCRLKQGHFSIIGRDQGLPNGVIGDIEDDGGGFFWMTSHGGVIRASQAELNDCAEGKIYAVHCLTYGINDGLPTLECSEGLQPAGCKTSDGRLWFPTSKGLVVINPNEVRINQLPPPMVLEEMLVDGALVTNTSSPLIISPGHSRLKFNYTGLSFVAPEKVQFKYRIEGLEKDWVDAGAKRMVDYNFVPPGNYTFHVIACNNDGIWNETGVSLPFTLLPHFWQTWWFHLLGGLATVFAASAMVWFDMRRRMRRRLEKLERQQAVERERARIAKDIHDDLGASLTRITMLSQSVRSEVQIPEYISANLKRIHGTARELTRSMDEIVWAVNPRHDTLDSLASYFSRFAYDFLSTANVRCRLDVPLQLPDWELPAEIRHNLFLSFKETLNNVIRHASASEVRVSLELALQKFILTVADDGCGFNTDRSRSVPLQPTDRISHGNGLVNMKRRLAEVHGTCEIQSAPGRGTIVKFSVPVPT